MSWRGLPSEEQAWVADNACSMSGPGLADAFEARFGRREAEGRLRSVAFTWHRTVGSGDPLAWPEGAWLRACAGERPYTLDELLALFSERWGWDLPRWQLRQFLKREGIAWLRGRRRRRYAPVRRPK